MATDISSEQALQKSLEVNSKQPEIRAQLSVLKKFMERIDFVRMQPDTSSVRVLRPNGVTARVLSEPGVAYAIYIGARGPYELELSLPSAGYEADWIDPKSGKVLKRQRFFRSSTPHRVYFDPVLEDLVLNLKKTQ